MSANLTAVALAGVPTYPTIPQISLGYVPDFYIFKLAAGDGAYISFDGVNDHWRFLSGDFTLLIPVRYQKLWLRQYGVINPTTIDVLTSNNSSRI